MSTQTSTQLSTSSRPTSYLSTSPSYITHQRRPALIPPDVQLSPEDEQSVRMRTGYVDPLSKGVVFSGDLMRRSEGKELDGKKKRKRVASKDDGEDGGEKDCSGGGGNGDCEMDEPGGEGK